MIMYGWAGLSGRLSPFCLPYTTTLNYTSGKGMICGYVG